MIYSRSVLLLVLLLHIYAHAALDSLQRYEFFMQTTIKKFGVTHDEALLRYHLNNLSYPFTDVWDYETITFDLATTHLLDKRSPSKPIVYWWLKEGFEKVGWDVTQLTEPSRHEKEEEKIEYTKRLTLRAYPLLYERAQWFTLIVFAEAGDEEALKTLGMNAQQLLNADFLSVHDKKRIGKLIQSKKANL